MRKFFLLFLFLFLVFIPGSVQAASNSFVSIVNPVRGDEFNESGQKPDLVVSEELKILNQNKVPATWLMRFDALKNAGLINIVKNSGSQYEKGLLLEITPTWTDKAQVKYNQTGVWHNAGSIFLTGYSQDNRKKLIDTAFEEFKSAFGFYPKSVGAWWIDAYSLDYMQKKYGISGALIVADQYSTDNYQIWGQYWSAPYYPALKNALTPAQNVSSKIPVVMMQWAARDPVNGYGKGVEESTYSVQANDYLDYHNLDSQYFSKLIDVLTQQKLNQVNQVVVGLENSYSWEKYGGEYKKQVDVLVQKSKSGSLSLVTMDSFASWYKGRFPETSPVQVIVADDPLGSQNEHSSSSNKAVWFMNNHYRVGWFFNSEGSVVRDVRQYVDGSEEICFAKPCNDLNFATFATRVLDDVTYHQKWVLDAGKISSFDFKKVGEDYVLSYKNSADLVRELKFLPRDISFNGKTSTIDGLILDVTSKQEGISNQQKGNYISVLRFGLGEIVTILWQLVVFILFFKFVIFVPGFVIERKVLSKKVTDLESIFLAVVIGMVSLTVLSFISNFFKIGWLIYFYVMVSLVLFIKQKLYLSFFKINFKKKNLGILVLILVGTIFQVIPVYKSGLMFEYGMGLWGPNTHDGMWHISLINQIMRSLPPQNPIFAGVNLQNYHYFYDVLIAEAAKLTMLPLANLLFRLFPVIFSAFLGIGSYLLAMKLFKSKLAAFLAVYFVYFAGSFGWIVSALKNEQWGGESAFWVNQSISFNLNPPFAISVLIIIAILILIQYWIEFRNKSLFLLIAILSGTLISFKAYGAILLLMTFFIMAVILVFKKKFEYFKLLFGSGIVAGFTLLPQYQVSQLAQLSSSGLFDFSPFWFIHTMIDYPDRVGWLKLSTARDAYFQRGDWVKYIMAEGLGLFLFIFGNLGLRFLGLYSLVKSKNRTFLEGTLLIFITLSLVIPIFIIQKGTPWNSIQFFYYGLFFVALYAGVGLSVIYRKLPTVIGAVFLLIVLILTPISSLTTANGYNTPYPHAFVSKAELEGLQLLSTKPDGTVLTYPFDKSLRGEISEPFPLLAYDSTAYVSALSKKATFVEDEPQNDILQTDYVKRLLIAKEIFDKPDYAKSNLEKNRIKYIYLPKIYNKTLNEQDIGLKKVFENKEVLIYETTY